MHQHCIAAALPGQLHQAAGGAVLEGIVHQVDQTLLEALRIPHRVHSMLSLGRFRRQMQPSGSHGPQAIDHLKAGRSHIETLTPQGELAGITAGDIKQIGHHASHPGRLLLNQMELFPLRGAEVDAAALQAGRIAGHQGDRRTQFVAHGIHEGSLPLPGHRQAIEQIVEGAGDSLQFAGLGSQRQALAPKGFGFDLHHPVAELLQGPESGVQHRPQQGGAHQGG